MKYQGFVNRFKAWKAALGLTNYGIEKRTSYSRANLTNLEKGLIGPSDDLLEKLASIPEYNISIKDLMAWRALDEYGSETISAAHEVIEGAASAKASGRAGASGMVIPPPQPSLPPEEIPLDQLMDRIRDLPAEQFVEILEHRFGLSRDVMLAMIEAERKRKNGK